MRRQLGLLAIAAAIVAVDVIVGVGVWTLLVTFGWRR